MAANFIEANKQHDIIRQAIRGAQLLREAEDNLAAALAGMTAMTDGEDFSLLASKCGIQQNGYASAAAAAETLFDETNSVAGNAAAGIAAAKQLCAYLGV